MSYWWVDDHIVEEDVDGGRGAEIELEEPEYVFVTVVGQSSIEEARPYELVRRIIPECECKSHRPEEDYHPQRPAGCERG